jgi:guanine deaminase
VGREGQAKTGISIPPAALWWQHTAGAALALDLGGVVGNLLPGCEADLIAINPRATPLLARRTAQASNLDELLFALIVLGDDRAVAHTLVQGQVVDPVLYSFHERDVPPADHPAVGP